MPALRLQVASTQPSDTRDVREPGLPLAVLGPAPTEAYQAPEEAVNIYDDLEERVEAPQQQEKERFLSCVKSIKGSL